MAAGWHNENIDVMPDVETIQSIGGLGGIGAVFGFSIFGAAIWFLKEHFKIQRENEEYRRKRDDAFLTALNTAIATIAELKNSVDRFTEVDRIVERLRAGHVDTETK